ncbi:hypothetical protein ACC691_36915, partial [Rhizobium johnstonii]|uniref:hypothetical protein n=1 Tax=Rhizobium johnstonii TaxID=3019933 RepID=UPI003F9715BB
GNPINLRVENDERHAELVETLGEIKRDIGGIRQDNRQMRRDHGALTERVDHLYDLETTRPRPPKGTS